MPTAEGSTTPYVVIVKVLEVVPAVTVRLAGTVARFVSELARVTTAPPAGAGPFSVTVPVRAVPPPMLAAAVTLTRTTEGVTARVAEAVRPPVVAEMSAVVGEATPTVETVNVAVFVAAATVTLAGTVATAVFELVSVTTVSPVGAFPSRVTVPVAEAPPTRLLMFRATSATAGVGVTSSTACLTVPASVAERVAVEATATVFAVTVKLADEAPAATVTLAGTVATATFELERAIRMPPAGATVLRLTEPVTVVAERALGAASVRPLRAAAGVTSSAAVRVSAPRVAERVTVWRLETGRVETVKPASEAPCGTATVAGTTATARLELPSETSVPPAGAGPLSATVPSTPPPPTALRGLTVREVSVWPASGVPKSRHTKASERDQGLPVRTAMPFLAKASFQ